VQGEGEEIPSFTDRPARAYRAPFSIAALFTCAPRNATLAATSLSFRLNSGLTNNLLIGGI
jgi:hypothetical protein